MSVVGKPGPVVFLSSVCVMTLEIVAGRMVAPYVGVSLYTWTSVIGVVLAGISLGNLAGGHLADRHPSTRLLGAALVAAGLASLGALAIEPLSRLTPASWPLLGHVLVLAAVLFLPPSFLLGAIPPVASKLAVRDLGSTGRTVGGIFAAGAAGSILGTFATGFLLIAWLGTHQIVLVVGAALILYGAWILAGGGRPALAVSVLTITATGFVAERGWASGSCERESGYHCIRVREFTLDGLPARALLLDRLVHSVGYPSQPTRLLYEYEKVFADLAGLVSDEKKRFRALVIGGGGYTLPRYLETAHPEAEIHVVEIDREVTEVARDRFGLGRDTRILTFHRDARVFLNGPPSRHYDVVFGDAFNDLAVPYHLTTREFHERVRAWLTEDGVYAVNLVDRAGGPLVRSLVRTLRESFERVIVRPLVSDLPGRRRTAFVLLATDGALGSEASRAGRASRLAIGSLSPARLDRLLRAGPAHILTDRFAPVDQLVLPTFDRF